jgi:hypothetical protein
LLESGYKNKMEAFKAEYREAFGQAVPDGMIESYVSTINNGKMVVNFGVAIGAIVAAPFTGGGSLAVFAAGAGALMALNAAEKSTDADGYTNSEWTSDATQAMWDGALGAIGVKVGMSVGQAFNGGAKIFSSKASNAILSKLKPDNVKKLTDLAAKIETSSNKVTQNALTKRTKLFTEKFPKWTSAQAQKAAIYLTRAEALGLEFISDSIQATLYSYGLEGEFDWDTVKFAMLLSLGGNAVGHAIAARQSAKTHIVDPKNENTITKATRDGNNPAEVAPERSVGKLLASLKKRVGAFQDRGQRRALDAKITSREIEINRIKQANKKFANEIESDLESKFPAAKKQVEDVFATITMDIPGSKVIGRPKNATSIADKLDTKVLKKNKNINNISSATEAIGDGIGTRLIVNNVSKANMQKVTDALVKAIKNDEIIITEIHNYSGAGSKPYFTDKQVKQIQKAMLKKGRKIEVETGSVAEKPSGYTSTHCNIIHKNGALGELQIRGPKVNTFGEVEHIPYDVRQDKIVTEPEYKPIEKAAISLTKDQYDKVYMKYLNELYAWCTNLERGIPTKQPAFPEGLPRELSYDNMMEAHNMVEARKKQKKNYQQKISLRKE